IGCPVALPKSYIFTLITTLRRHYLTRFFLEKIGLSGNHTLVDEFFKGLVKRNKSKVKQKFGPHTAIEQMTYRMLSSADIQINLVPIICKFFCSKNVRIMRVHIP